jgi:ubiquinone/menaquinone biosynthesis C-methylase UbiE
MRFIKRKNGNVFDVRRYYSEWTERYIKSFGDTFQANRPTDLKSYFEYLLKSIDIQKGFHVIDAGCGVGGPLFGLAKVVDAKFTGLNISPEQVEIANKRLSEEGVNNVSFVECDFHKLGQEVLPETIDRVYFLESLVHSSDIKRVINEVHKALKPYGKIYIKDLFERVAVSKEDKAKILNSVKINNELFKLFIQPKEKLLWELREAGFKLDFCRQLEIETNQDVGNRFVIENGLVKHESDWHPYLEFYEIRATKIISAFD